MATSENGSFRCDVDEVIRVRRYENGKLAYVSYMDKEEAETVRQALGEHSFDALMKQFNTQPAKADASAPVVDTL